MRLLLMRHANTETPSYKPDLERLLTECGKTEASIAANFLNQHQINKILVSHAQRAMQTSRIIQNQVTKAELEIVTELYQNDTNAIINLLKKQKNHNKNILVIGHNPLIIDVALSLADSDSTKYEFLISSMMPTARIIILDFPKISNWSQLASNKGNISEIFTPQVH